MTTKLEPDAWRTAHMRLSIPIRMWVAVLACLSDVPQAVGDIMYDSGYRRDDVMRVMMGAKTFGFGVSGTVKKGYCLDPSRARDKWLGEAFRDEFLM